VITFPLLQRQKPRHQRRDRMFAGQPSIYASVRHPDHIRKLRSV